MDRKDWQLLIFAASLWIGLLLFGAVMQHAFGHDGVNDDWYESLEVPGHDGWSCCNKHDCAPVKARIRGDGQWEAWIDKDTFPDPVEYEFGQGNAPNAWVVVPDEAILHGKDNPTGEPVACFYMRMIRCFVPGVEI